MVAPGRRAIAWHFLPSMVVAAMPLTTVFINRAAARLAVFNYIESWFNPWRRYDAFGMHSPAEFERRWRAAEEAEDVTK